MKYLHSLKKLGLTEDQSKVYEALLSATILPVRIISKNSSVTRELCYVVLKQLENMGFVEKVSQGKVILFRASNPRNIKKLVEKKQEEALLAQESYQDVILKMVGDFNINHHKPFIKFYEGLEGLQKTYDHILRHAKIVRVIRSLYDYENKEVRALVSDQIKKQAKKGIKSYVLSPKLDHMKEEKVTFSQEKNIIRKVVPKNQLILPAQVIIYNNTVSITSMRKGVITTIIENEDIASTFLVLFSYMWDREE